MFTVLRTPPSAPKVKCVSIISRTNVPLFISVPPTEDNIIFHFLTHTAIDFISERLVTDKNSLKGACFLDLLFPAEIHRVYGYVTPTGTKLVAIIDDSDVTKSAMEKFFHSVHGILMKVMLNPFFDDSQLISSQFFHSRIMTSCMALEQELKSAFKG
ncbi:hypothetical protein RCL1_004362 [Eukaryota sp. TZLM3-RCL]